MTFLSAFLWAVALARKESTQPDPLGLVSKVVSDIVASERSQKRLLPPYRVVKRYTVKNSKLQTPAVLEVLWTFNPQTGKRFEILKNQNASGLTRRALIELLENESKNSRLEEDPGSITPNHYAFELVSVEPNELRLRVTALKKSKYLLNGYAFVRTGGAAIRRVEGTTSKRLSFWVSEARIEQDFGQFGKFWLPTKTRSSARIRFIGQTELTIDAGDYQFAGEPTVN